MASILTVVVPLILVLVLVALALRYLLRSWLDYRVRIAVLEAMDRAPEQISESAKNGEVVLAGRGVPGKSRVDYLISGIALGVIGLCCVLIGWNLRVGQLAVGVYLGGIFCLCLGFFLGIVGVLVRRMRRPLSPEK